MHIDRILHCYFPSLSYSCWFLRVFYFCFVFVCFGCCFVLFYLPVVTLLSHDFCMQDLCKQPYLPWDYDSDSHIASRKQSFSAHFALPLLTLMVFPHLLQWCFIGFAGSNIHILSKAQHSKLLLLATLSIVRLFYKLSLQKKKLL